MSERIKQALWVFLALRAVSWAPCAQAGPTNPNFSAIGQPQIRWTDDADDPSGKRPVFDVGELELVIEDYLNPYSRGWVTLAIGEEGLELEEGYVQIVRGLPMNLNLKAGKYRLEFGKLNAVHPHAYPFAERFHLLEAYLPGEESFNEQAVQLSMRLPSPGETSIVASIDWLRGDSFRLEREDSGAVDDPLILDEDGDHAEEYRPGVLGRISTFIPVHDQSGLELGLSASTGTNNVAAKARTNLFGADAKLKYWTGDRSYWLLQTEFVQLTRDEAEWIAGSGYATSQVDPFGFYVYSDYNWNIRWNVGASYERFQEPTEDEEVDHAVGAYAGFAVLEESTVIRLGFERFIPEVGDAIDTLTLRLVYSMGPHKAHQF